MSEALLCAILLLLFLMAISNILIHCNVSDIGGQINSQLKKYFKEIPQPKRKKCCKCGQVLKDTKGK